MKPTERVVASNGCAVRSRTNALRLSGSLAVLIALTVWAGVAGAQGTERDHAPRRDEFGRIPEDASDKDLVLPDRVLDRTWPGMEPGREGIVAPGVASDEEDLDPFRDEVEPQPEPNPTEQYRRDEERAEQAEPPRALPPARPPVGPDGKYDVGSPIEEADPAFPEMLEMDDHELSEMEMEENLPSPLDQDDSSFEQEAGDPGYW